MKKFEKQNSHPLNVFIGGNIAVDFFHEKLYPEVCVTVRMLRELFSDTGMTFKLSNQTVQPPSMTDTLFYSSDEKVKAIGYNCLHSH